MPRLSPSRAFLYLTSLTLGTSCGGEPASDTNTLTTAAATSGAVANPSAQPSASNPGSQSTSNVAASNTGAAPSAAPSSPLSPSASQVTTIPSSVSTTAATPSMAVSVANTAEPTTTGSAAASVTDPTPTMSSTGTVEPPPDIDQGGKGNATPGTTATDPQDYLRLGEIRILNNNWGSEYLGCTAPTSTMSVFVDQEQNFGWNFSRGGCAPAMDSSHPDFPQLEFGIHPFGIGSDLVTSPEFSSTTLLPLQISEIMSASVSLDNLTITLQNQDSWNLSMEFWLSEGDPRLPNPKVYAELMAWWGWDAMRWPCDLNGDGIVDYGDRVPAGNMDYTLCHQDDNWADGQWRYYQFRAGDGSDGNIRNSFSGKLDVKAFLDYLVNVRHYPTTLWLTRMEVGSEIDDDTSGTVKMNNVTFEVNGESRSKVIGVP